MLKLFLLGFSLLLIPSQSSAAGTLRCGKAIVVDGATVRFVIKEFGVDRSLTVLTNSDAALIAGVGLAGTVNDKLDIVGALFVLDRRTLQFRFADLRPDTSDQKIEHGICEK